MKTKQYLKNSIYSIAMALVSVGFVSCTDDIDVVDNVDEGAFGAATRVDGQLLDVTSNKNQNVVDLRGETQDLNVYFSLTQLPKKGVDVQIDVDAEYLKTFNANREDKFELFPLDLVSIENEGKLLLAPDELRSTSVAVTLAKGATLESGKTYVLPLRVTSTTDGITISQKSSHAVYMIKPILGEGANDTFKGNGAVKTVLYFEANDTNPLNALTYLLEDGSLFFDEIILFAANINYNADKGLIYLHCNPNIQFLLDNNEKYLQPLRKRGIKVHLGLLGNHDCSGLAQLSDVGAKMFAKELADYVYAYNIDGVNMDDEYSDAPDLSSPLFASASAYAGSRLCYETKLAMPDKTVSIYNLGRIYSHSMTSVDGVEPAHFIDYAVADYGGFSSPVKGATLAQCSGMSIELNRGSGNSSETFARDQTNKGYGYYMFFALYGNPDKQDNYHRMQHYGRCASVCRGLYGRELLIPTHYYRKADTTPYLMTE